MILCYLYRYRYIICTTMFQAGNVYPNEQYNIENFGVLMCPLSILIFFFFFFLGPFRIPLGRLAHLIKNSPKFLITGKNQFTGIVPKHIKKKRNIQELRSKFWNWLLQYQVLGTNIIPELGVHYCWQDSGIF